MTTIVEEIVRIAEGLSEENAERVKVYAQQLRNQEERRRRQPTGMGKFAYLGISSYEFDRRSAEEKKLEEANEERLHRGEG